jgi:ferredoxin
VTVRRPVVDRTLCEGHALCLTTAPEVFEVDPTERAFVLDVAVTETLGTTIDQAIDMCPTRAISWKEEP